MIDILIKKLQLEESLVELYEHQLKQIKDKTYTENNIRYHKLKILELTNEIAKLYSTLDVDENK